MTKGHSRLRTFCREKQPAKEINKSIQPNHNEVWKAHLCPEILPISVRNLAEESKDREGLGESRGYPRKQDHSGQSSNSRPGERLGRMFQEERVRDGPLICAQRGPEMH